ncbi:hypothetical protein [Mycobacterium sp. E740]|uniref:hypothetical protein n=1 Tax=Mycobacterium sp. E740 TaxID=1834149 RepID=UPI000801EA95|nr:hypothetical protein [Mycobacterium sp. E740]OBI75842.1 hypothetical protein A5663_03795 [Mycobacterium sp. E740]
MTAGACVLAAGLMFGAGAIAAADSDSGGSAGGGTGGSSQGTSGGTQSAGTSSATTSSSTNTQAKTGPGATQGPRIRLSIPRLSVPRLSGTRDRLTPSTRVGDKQGTASDEVESSATGQETASAAEQTAPSTEAPVTPAAATPAATPSATPSATAYSSGTTSTTPVATPAATAPAAKSMPPAPGALQPVTNVVTTFTDVLSSVPQTLGALQTSRTPVRDAIASVEAMLTTMTKAVTQASGDLYALLGVRPSTGPVAPLIGGGGALDAVTVHAAADAPMIGPLAVQVPPAPVSAPSTSLFGTMAPHPSLGKVAAAGLNQPLSVSGTVPLKTATPTSAKSIFDHVIDAVLVPASLTALAAVALPGLGALLVVAAAGIRVGYRQAKAGLALRASGITRFAGSGPLGVVRSGSMVALRQRARGPRTKRAVCPDVSRSAPKVERVA